MTSCFPAKRHVPIALAFCLALPFHAASANVSGLDVHSNPERFVHRLVTGHLVEGEFLYCKVDIKYFDGLKSANCLYTVSKFNILLKKFGLGAFDYDDYELISTLLDQIEVAVELEK